MNIPNHFFTASLNNRKLLNVQEGKNWIPCSAKDFLDQIKKASLGLNAKLKIKKGSLIGLISPSNPTWVIYDQVIMSSDLISVPMFVNVSQQNLKFQIHETKMQYVFICGEEALQTITPWLKSFKKVIYQNINKEKLPPKYKNDFISLDELIQEGEEFLKKQKSQKDIFLDNLKKIKSNQVATIIYTSGTTGEPKGVMLTHDNLLSQIKAANKVFPFDYHKDHVISCLPLAHIFERTIINVFISQNLSIYFSPNIAQVGNNIREIKPTAMTVVPRILIKVYEKISSSPQTLSGLKKKLVQSAIDYAETHDPNQKHTWHHKIYDKMVYNKFRQALGGNFRVLVSGGAALPEVILKFFTNIGIYLVEGYGLTETSPVISANNLSYNKLFTVGPLFEGVTAKISKDDEILVKGTGVMKGYYKKPQLTKSVFTKDKWFKTGDQGKIDSEGNLVILGRIKDLYKLSNGKYVAPLPIEQKLEINPWIETALLVADGQKYVTVLLFMNTEKTPEEANANHYEDTIKQDLAEINKELNPWEKIVKYKCIWHKLTIEAGEITPKLNIRRAILIKKFQAEIKKLY